MFHAREWTGGRSAGMASSMRSAFVLILATGLYGCASKPPLLLRATVEAASCTLQADAVTLSGEQASESHSRLLAAVQGRRRVILDADAHLPYRCVGHAIFYLQRAGFRIVSARANGVELERE